MRGNKCLLDANVVLRFLLQDNEEQFQYVKKITRYENCYVTLEIFDKIPKLDFVDCLLYVNRNEMVVDIITFDRKLQKWLDDV